MTPDRIKQMQSDAAECGDHDAPGDAIETLADWLSANWGILCPGQTRRC